ncbi:hypothetical protein SAMN05192549_1344 [Duganella sacchari]|uniref:Uncharacterized protein n=4 Tax=Duganella sacchari TaxID=551987 RepID=A0A1M7RFJ4_9BURK|nr:hypothetical protein [Duganella sacchari]SHN45014.1 hypothetical protein SAMN05192549_1344 [Duganella sacchari]
MHNSPRFTINRHLIILMPKQPVLDWIKRVDPNPPNLTLDQLRLEQNAFLISDDLDGQQDAEKWVQRRWQMFFEGFLAEWYTVESWWPQRRTFKMFKDWFDVQYHSMVWDMAAKEPITYEDWESPDDEVPVS